MPPASDVRSFAEQLRGCGEYITFYDTWPLCCMARDMVHLPAATVHALTALHDAERSTLGARALLGQLLRSYHSRRQSQIALGKRPLGDQHDGRAIRLLPGALCSLTLRTPPGTRWAVSVGPPGAEATVSLQAEGEPGRSVQHFSLEALGPGVVQLEAQRHRIPARAPARNVQGQAANAQPAPGGLVRWTLTVVVEPADALPEDGA